MKNIYTKLSNIQGLRVKKDASNPFFKSNYQSLDEIVSTLAPVLHENKLLVFHASKEGHVETTVADIESGEIIVSSFKLPEISDIQKLGAAITYAKRYNLGQLFNIVTDPDDDGNEAAQHKDTYSQAREVFDDKPWLDDATFDLKVTSWISGEYTKGNKMNTQTILSELRKKYKVAKKYEQVISEHIAKI
jgi:hypothetical protein